jgi:hypothetical protein
MKKDIKDIAKKIGCHIYDLGLKSYEYKDKVDRFINPNLTDTVHIKAHRADVLQLLVVLGFINPKLGKFIKSHSIGSPYDTNEAQIEIDKSFADYLEIEAYIEKVRFRPPYSNEYIYKHHFLLNEEKLKLLAEDKKLKT